MAAQDASLFAGITPTKPNTLYNDLFEIYGDAVDFVESVVDVIEATPQYVVDALDATWEWIVSIDYSLDNVLNTTDRVFAGFAYVVTFGYSNQWRESLYGEIATRNHEGFAYNVGQAFGFLVSLGIGAGAGTASTAGRIALTYNLAGDVIGVTQSIVTYSTQGFLNDNGSFNWQPLLGFVPTIGWGANGLRGLRGAGGFSQVDDLGRVGNNLTGVRGGSEFVEDLARSADDASALIQPIGRTEGLGRVISLRNQFGISRGKNIAFADVQVTAFRGELKGLSGKSIAQARVAAGFAPIPRFRRFITGLTDFDTPAAHDAEVLLLEDLASKLTHESFGTVRLFSERPVCGSCLGVIEQFRASFPRIELLVSSGPRLFKGV